MLWCIEAVAAVEQARVDHMGWIKIGRDILGASDPSPDFYPPHMNVELPVPSPLHTTLVSTTLCACPPLHDSAPPTCLDECGLFKSLVVRRPHSSIF